MDIYRRRYGVRMCLMADKCKNCKYYDKIDNEKGYCHKYPPTIHYNNVDRFAITPKNEWCGEYEAEEE